MYTPVGVLFVCARTICLLPIIPEILRTCLSLSINRNPRYRLTMLLVAICIWFVTSAQKQYDIREYVLKLAPETCSSFLIHQHLKVVSRDRCAMTSVLFLSLQVVATVNNVTITSVSKGNRSSNMNSLEWYKLFRVVIFVLCAEICRN